MSTLDFIQTSINHPINITQTPPPPLSIHPCVQEIQEKRGQGGELLLVQQRNKIRDGALLESVGLDLGLGEFVGISQISAMGGNSGGW